jgi:ubiquitin C-terminal hydrolase
MISRYVDSVESGDHSDEWVAAESWRRHLLRNDSVIVDIFQGQFKSHLTCPNESCKGKSWRKFDPFQAIPCPVRCHSRRLNTHPTAYHAQGWG